MDAKARLFQEDGRGVEVWNALFLNRNAQRLSRVDAYEARTRVEGQNDQDTHHEFTDAVVLLADTLRDINERTLTPEMRTVLGSYFDLSKNELVKVEAIVGSPEEGKTRMVPRLLTELPDVLGSVWFTPTGSSTPVRMNNSNYKNYLRTLAYTVYANGMGAVGSGAIPSSMNTLSLDTGKLVKEIASSPGDFSFTKMEEGENCRDFRDPGEEWTNVRGVLQKTVDGEVVAIDDVDRELTLKNNCFTTAVSADGNDCKRFIHDCLLDNNSNDLESCMSYLHRGGEFWKGTQAQIKEMHPEVARQLLGRLGFQEHDVYDSTAGRNLRKVQSVAKWIESLTVSSLGSKATSDQLNSIVNNASLRTYLDLVVDFVNCHPGILNRDYSGDSDEKVGVVYTPGYIRDMGIPARIASVGAKNDMSRLLHTRRSDMAVRKVISGPKLVASHPLGKGVLAVTSSPPIVLGMRGGGSDLADRVASHMESKQVAGSGLMSEIYTTLLRRLQAHGKDISEEDKNKVSERLVQLKKLEDELIRTLRLYDDASRISNLLRNKNKQVLTEEDLRRIATHANKVENKLNKRELDMATICEAMTQILEDKVGNSTYPLGSKAF
tara:strand:+ start:6056 stop:7873 length:1818 start_codon:yes stop_codon:yes gene_type:complete